ncbi:hypothetical protein J4573_11440 [Actinomadura barringtoniae]|uniref:Uncharacterized protein n=1 Tax=Actinomadura barringtoniae TaxID=1427535 RepID=A0A939PDJ1_9ACTN|nr:hypothetical protein [Actinomadura barringtoniae]MBO2447704.1 hypothetical protein [Actinomadura barringtoniae]
MAAALLPAEFAELERFAEIWSLETETRRYERRLNSSMAEMQEFYDAFFPRLEEAIAYCDKFPLDDLPEDALRLLWLVYALVMIAMAIEVFQQPKATDAADAEIIRVKEPIP